MFTTPKISVIYRYYYILPPFQNFTNCPLQPNGDPVGIRVVAQTTSPLPTATFPTRSSTQAQMIVTTGSMRGGAAQSLTLRTVF